MRNAVIRATGAYLPKRVLPNSYFNESLGVNVSDWLEQTLDIHERRWCDADESTVDLCEHAARQALDRAGLRPRDLDLIIVATDTPEYLTPATAAVLQDRIKAGHAGTFDLNAACAGFVTGVEVASKFIRTDPRYTHVLVIGAYAISKFLNPKDKKTVTLFADGAGAILLEAQETEERGILDSELITLGQYYDGMGIYGGGARNPASYELIEHQAHTLRFNYRFPPELNPQIWTHMARGMLGRLGWRPLDVDHYLLTQININSIRKTLDNLDVPHARAHTAMQYYGYTGSACIPIALNAAVEQGKIQPGERMLMIGSGSGLTFAGVALRY
ncbi:MAG: ketoacyl-ACP synthase III [Bacteroidia bacterium]|nr:ketoacyl-ACP synthase III [Bacteroidia bacterium]